MQPSNRALMHSIARAHLLDLLRKRGPLARSELATLVGFEKKHITNIVTKLAAEGLVHEVGQRQAGIGRPLKLLDLDGSRRVAGLHLEPGRMRGVVVDWRGTKQATAEVEFAGTATPAVVRRTASALLARLASSGKKTSSGKKPPSGKKIPAEQLEGLGLALPAIIDPVSGKILRSVNLPKLEGASLGDLLPADAAPRTFIENSANALALAEKWFGHGRDARDLVCVELGVGVGAGIVIDRRLYRGAGLFAGELGHVRIAADGPVCSCGARGCLEGWLGWDRLTAALGGAESLPATESELSRSQRATLVAAAERLGQALAVIVNLLNPRLLVLSGDVMRYQGLFVPAVEAALARAALPDCLQGLTISTTRDPFQGALGAACLALAERFEVDGHYAT